MSSLGRFDVMQTNRVVKLINKLHVQTVCESHDLNMDLRLFKNGLKQQRAYVHVYRQRMPRGVARPG